MKGSLLQYKCTKVGDYTCSVAIICNNCTLLEEASILITSREKTSYATFLYANVTSDSSIPNEISSIKNKLYPSENYIFIGSEASTFYYTITPSLSTSESSNWPSKRTGYHISSDKPPMKGSQSLIIDLSITCGLKVLIILYKSDTGLVTQRLLKQSILIFISGII